MLSNLNNLKIFSFSYIAEHDRLTKDEKLQLGEFVKVANKDQVLNLLITGYPQSKAISEKFVKENEELVSEVDPYLAVGGAIIIGGTVLAMSIISAAYHVYRDHISKVGKRCVKYDAGPEKKWCMAKVKAEGYTKQIKALQVGMKKCQKTKDPSKCTNKIKQKIINLQGKAKVQLAKAKKESEKRLYKDKG